MGTQQGQQPSEEDIFYITWGQETIKNNIALCNEILKQLITISSALLGVSIIYDKIIQNNNAKVCVLLSFFISLILAFIGVLPYEKKVSLNSPSDIKTHKQNALRHKRFFLWISAATLVIGFGIVIVEIII